MLTLSAIPASAAPSPYGPGNDEPAVGQLKILARYNDGMQFYDGHVYLLFTSYRDGVTISVPDLYAGYEISEQYYTDIRENIANGSNHTNPPGSDPEEEAGKYFTLNKDMTSVTLNRGEIVTVGMYRDFDLSVPEAAMGCILNSTVVREGGDAADTAKTAFMENLFHYLKYGTHAADNALTDLFAELQAQGIDINLFLDGTVGGGVCFNRELYNQKLEWDQYENVTFELDITETQLRRMEQALAGNLDKFSILKNSCATVALRAWNAAVGMEDGNRTEYYLEPAGTGIFAYIDAPKSVKDEIMDKLPGYYLNNAEMVEEPNAGYQDETGWVYVSAPEVLDPGRRMTAGNVGSGMAKEAGPYVGRLTIATRHFFGAQIVAHSLINFTTYEDLDLAVSCYRYYKPTDKYIALMEAYEDNPNAYPSDPALYSDGIPLEDRASYFELLDYGTRSEPGTIRLKAGEGITVSNYPHDADRLLTAIRTLDSSAIAETCVYTPILIAEMQYYEDNDAVNNGSLAFDTMMATLTQIYKEMRETGVNPVTGTSDGGMDVNREAYNQFVFDDVQASYAFYTVEITAEELEALRGYLADPGNNYYGLAVMNCSTGVVDIWNTALSDRPELRLTGNLTGFCAEPESIWIELDCLKTKTGKLFDGSGEGWGTHFYPRIEPAYERLTPPEQPGASYSDPVWDHSDPENVTATFYRTDDPSAPPVVVRADVTAEIRAEPSQRREGIIVYTAAAKGPDGRLYTTTWTEVIPKLPGGSDPGDGGGIFGSLLLGRQFNPPKPTDEAPVIPKETSGLPFTDIIAGGDLYDIVKYVYDRKIMNGVSDTEFSPYTTLTRGMIVTILYRLEGEPFIAYSGAFTDVPDGTWYTAGVEWAALNGIVNGYGDGRFGPEDPVTREQLAAILYRYADRKGCDVSVGEDTNILSYDDAFDICDWAMSAVQWACGTGVLDSGSGSLLRPADEATRAEVAQAIRAFLETRTA